jgi:hypothetical protein
LIISACIIALIRKCWTVCPVLSQTARSLTPCRIVEEIHGDDRDGAHRIRLELVNPEAARLYAASQRARDEYPELPVRIQDGLGWTGLGCRL